MLSNTYSNGTTPEICIIGAGFSGLFAGIQLKRMLNMTTFEIYDENHDIGGTWLANTYPGCACDIPSHFYCWSFELNPDWSQVYSSSSEILQYLKNVTKKYDLYPHIKLNTQVNDALWDETTQKWHVTVLNKETKKKETLLYDIVISGTGLLRSPNIPKEFESFKGKLMHSGQWDHTVDLTDKIVGIVGSGSSAIQIISSISNTVKELHCYQRKPPHVVPRLQGNYWQSWKLICNYFPPVMWLHRLLIFILFELFHLTFYPNIPGRRTFKDLATMYRKIQVKNPELEKRLTPSFEFGCKRLLFHESYYKVCKNSNVTIHTDKIIEIMKNNVICQDGSKTKLDVLILATGYKASDYMDPMNVVGKDSIKINEIWKQDKPSLYLGIITNKAPNFFLLLGPNTLLGHSSVIWMSECQVNYIIQGIRIMMSRNVRVIRPKESKEKNYMEKITSDLNKMVWAKCDSWYRDVRGNITQLYPYKLTSYWITMRRFNLEDYDTA